MKKSKSLVTLILASFFFFFSVKGLASELNFAVNPVIPENQIDKAKTYFDLKMAPGSVQTVEVQLRNDTNNDVVIEPKIASATTNLNGVVEYGPNDIEPDETLKHNLKDLVEVAETITIPKKSQITLPIKIKMPAEDFTGVISGGVTFKEKTAATADSSTDKGLAIKNEYAYVVGILLRQTTDEVTPDLNLVAVAPSQVNARNVINVTLQNPTATYLNSFRLINEVTKKGQSDSLYSSDTAKMQMAPNSHFSYPISLQGQKLEAGEYVLKSVAYSGKSDQGQYKVKNGEEEETYLYKWEFEKEFTVAGDVARDLNQKDVTIEQDHTWIYLLIGLLLLILALLLIWYRRKKKDEE